MLCSWHSCLCDENRSGPSSSGCCVLRQHIWQLSPPGKSHMAWHWICRSRESWGLSSAALLSAPLALPFPSPLALPFPSHLSLVHVSLSAFLPPFLSCPCQASACEVGNLRRTSAPDYLTAPSGWEACPGICRHVSELLQHITRDDGEKKAENSAVRCPAAESRPQPSLSSLSYAGQGHWKGLGGFGPSRLLESLRSVPVALCAWDFPAHRPPATSVTLD